MRVKGACDVKNSECKNWVEVITSSFLTFLKVEDSRTESQLCAVGGLRNRICVPEREGARSERAKCAPSPKIRASAEPRTLT